MKNDKMKLYLRQTLTIWSTLFALSFGPWSAAFGNSGSNGIFPERYIGPISCDEALGFSPPVLPTILSRLWNRFMGTRSDSDSGANREINLEKFFKDRGSSELGKEDVFKLMFEIMFEIGNFERLLNLKNYLSEDMFRNVISEIWDEWPRAMNLQKEWPKSTNLQKIRFAVMLNKEWSEAIENGRLARIKALIESGFFDINHRNLSNVSILQLAAYYGQTKIIDWLVAESEFDFEAKDARGNNEVEQLFLSGKTALAKSILERKPGIRARIIEVIERDSDRRTFDYPEGSPIVDFVTIHPNSFMMGDGDIKYLTTVSEPFEVMSVPVTVGTYRRVVELIKEFLPDREGTFASLNPSPSIVPGLVDIEPAMARYGDENMPVTRVSDYDAFTWIEGLNLLSNLNHANVQRDLLKLFPSHERGKKYALPTEAEWELVARLGGVAEGDYPHGNEVADLPEFADFDRGGYFITIPKPVGSKKPVYYGGKPIYDLIGGTWEILTSRYDYHFSGGVDPEGPRSGGSRALRGGSHADNDDLEEKLGTDKRRSIGIGDDGNATIGFRLIRRKVQRDIYPY